MPSIETSQFGKNISNYIANAGMSFRLFYDHGDASEANVGKIYAHTGINPSRSTNLAEVDVMVVTEDDEVVIVIEIEEIASLGPKKYWGCSWRYF